MELLEKIKEQAINAGAEWKFEKVKKITKNGGKFTIVGENGEYLARAVIIATGGKHREAGIRGEKEFLGRGVSYCATCDGYFFKNKKVVVYGSGREAVEDAIYLHDIGCKVVIVARTPKLRVEKVLLDELAKRNIKIYYNCSIRRVVGREMVEGVVIYNRASKEEKQIDADGIFIAIGTRPATDIVAELGVERDAFGYIKVDREQRTNVEGVFAAGDCCDNPLKQVVTACGDGAVAAYSAYKYLSYKMSLRKPRSSERG